MNSDVNLVAQTLYQYMIVRDWDLRASLLLSSNVLNEQKVVER